MCIRDRVIASPMPVGTRLPERRDRDHDQRGIHAGNRLVVKAPDLHLLRMIVLDQYIRACEELEEDLSLIHISEPTRPNQISYASFCFKKKHTLSIRHFIECNPNRYCKYIDTEGLSFLNTDLKSIECYNQ